MKTVEVGAPQATAAIPSPEETHERPRWWGNGSMLASSLHGPPAGQKGSYNQSQASVRANIAGWFVFVILKSSLSALPLPVNTWTVSIGKQCINSQMCRISHTKAPFKWSWHNMFGSVEKRQSCAGLGSADSAQSQCLPFHRTTAKSHIF